jgi:ParB-like chromosome segregation protein Spo0J
MEQISLFNSEDNQAINAIIGKAKELFAQLKDMAPEIQIKAVNSIRAELHQYSPFKNEPVDCVLWIPGNQVEANDYNPNVVAPPEMKLLELSIREDGYTQPIVAWETNNHYEVVDGFHRNRIGKECKDIAERIHGYLPLSIINTDRLDKADRIASTIRHNRARGKHQVQGMSNIVLELKRRNWADAKISRELGMDSDEVLRLAQITGLAEMFANREFSEAWEANQITENDTIEIENESTPKQGA